MKHYKLSAWPDLPAPFHRTAYRRMLHQMSQRYVSVQQLVQESGLARGEVLQFLDTLSERALLDLREHSTPPARATGPFGWLRRAFSTEGRV